MITIKVLLAEDHTVVRQGIRSLLESEKDISVIGEAQTGREAVKLAEQLRPSVILMDIGMPLLNGTEATRQILKVLPDCRILILSAHDDSELIEQVYAAGAYGYLLKHNSSDMLAAAIREVYKGKKFFSQSVFKRLKTILSGSNLQITSRETEVLQLIAEGLANKQIAYELNISIKTVEKHRQHIMEKLGIHDTAGLTRYAVANGIIFVRKADTVTQD
ncbi:MAG: response regulator transcription factor [Oligoflexia bacterium]|nr:response regulator transcription factor [Oligoflexia bacterium]